MWQVLLIINCCFGFSTETTAAIPFITIGVDSTTARDTNQLDKKGKKTGLWIEKNGLVEVTYKQGLKDGAFKVYNKKTGKLECEGNYKKNKLTGSWTYFDDAQRAYLKVENITPNDSVYIVDGHIGHILPPYKAYLKSFYKNGALKEEGAAFFEDATAEFYMIGMWKFYDSNGDLSKQENYKKPKPH